MDALQYPIGPHQEVLNSTDAERQERIQRIAHFPQELKDFIVVFEASKWEKSYRPGGWNAIQLVNHLADSHLHSYARFKHAVTEDKPIIKDYPEAIWASTKEGNRKESVTASLLMIEGIHMRWSSFLKDLSPSDFDKTFYHPESKTHNSLHKALAYYSWHCDHHLGHLKIIHEQA